MPEEAGGSIECEVVSRVGYGTLDVYLDANNPQDCTENIEACPRWMDGRAPPATVGQLPRRCLSLGQRQLGF